MQQGEGEARWFLGALATIKSSGETTGGRVAVAENWAPRGHGSPLHVHHNEDEWFYVLSGELTFWVDGQVITATDGSFVYGPRDVPHTFTVTSEEAPCAGSVALGIYGCPIVPFESSRPAATSWSSPRRLEHSAAVNRLSQEPAANGIR